MILEDGTLFYEKNRGPLFDENGNSIRAMSWYELNKERIDKQRADKLQDRKGNRNKRKRKKR